MQILSDPASYQPDRKAEWMVLEGRIGKPCTRCGEPKVLEEFPTNSRTLDGRGSWCRRCLRLHIRQKSGGEKARLDTAGAGSVRRCAVQGCGAKLSRYNFGKVCGPCERKGREGSVA